MERTGKKIEKYILNKKIGRGSYGEVFLAKSIEDGKDFAVKCLNKEVRFRLPRTSIGKQPSRSF